MKQQKRNERPSPEAAKETAAAAPQETPTAYFEEAAIAEPLESAVPEYSEICGVNGCGTVYEDPIVMRRHKERQHGISGAQNLNQPKPRNENVRLA